MSKQIEDPGFAYGGYWKGTAAEIIQGDGVRFNDTEPCVLIQDVGIGHQGEVVLLVEDRAAHVASVFADAFGRPLEGMAADSSPAMRVLPANEPVWIRL